MSKDLIKADGPNVKLEAGISALKAIIGNIPYIGPLLNEVFFDCRSRLKQERVNAYFHEISEETRRIADDKIDFAYLKTAEFSDLMEDIIHKVAVNNSRTKRAYFSNLLTQAIRGHRPPDMSRVFIDILGEITDAELLLLAELYKLFKRSQQLQNEGRQVDPAIHVTKTDGKIFGVEYSEYVLMVQSMIRKGLLYDEMRWDSKAYEFILLNELGVRFYEYVTRT